MPITEEKNAFVDTGAVSLGLSQMFGVTAASSNPTYLVLTTLDRDEYTVGATGTPGTLTGNGHTLSFSSIGGDGRGAGIVFTYQASTGLYFNSTYGYFNALSYNASGSPGDVVDLSLFGTASLSLANSYASNVYDMMQFDPAGYLGTATVVTQPGFAGIAPAQATPDSIAAVAQRFVDQDWNQDGCWVLCSTIAAEAGAALSVQSSLIGMNGASNGEWIVAFDGPAAQSSNWQAMVKTGEMVVIGTPGGGGHITTVVSGAGSSAMVVDNAVFESQNGVVENAANDGSSSDIIIQAPHAASQEWTGVQAATVVIYELDTPVVTDAVTSDRLGFDASQSLAKLFTATDPAGKAITDWQIYNSASTDALVAGGVDYHNDVSAADALTAASLAAVSLLAGGTATTDTLEVRAYNGSYWGEWQPLTVDITAAATAPPPPPPPAKAPTLDVQTANQIWTEGKSFSLVLPVGTFVDPQNQTLTYSAALPDGAALPGWLHFNPASDTFSGTPPNTAQTLTIAVKATDTAGLSATDTFSATVLSAPEVSTPTPKQSWTGGRTFSLTLPAGTFTDPQGENLFYTATQSNGMPLPAWLGFDAQTDTFSGTAPASAETVNVEVVATDTSGLSTSESFAASVAPAATPPTQQPKISVAPTPSQTWIDGETVDFNIPAGTFSDALGLPMRFTAFEVGGPNVTSWLYFDPTSQELFGTVPGFERGTVNLAVFATDSLHATAEDQFSVSLTGGGWHSPFAATVTSPGMAGVLLNPPEPANMLPFHS